MSFPSMVACNILEAYWDKQVPIKPEDIAQAIGIKVILKDLDADMSAIRQKEGEQPIIYVDTKQHSNHQRLALAHALGHYVLSQGDRPKPTDKEANAFAQELLMPKGVVDYVIKNTKNPTVQYLARQFWVSEEVMIDRLIRTGWCGQSLGQLLMHNQDQKQDTRPSAETLFGLTVVGTIGSLALSLLG